MSPTPHTPEPDPAANAEELSAYLDGELSPADCARVEEALAQDPDLRAALADLEEISRTLRSVPTLRAPDRILASVRSEISPRRAGSFPRPSLFQQFGVQGLLGWAALILIAVTAGVWFFGFGSDIAQPGSSVDSLARSSTTENADSRKPGLADDAHSETTSATPVRDSARKGQERNARPVPPPSEAARHEGAPPAPRLGKREDTLSDGVWSSEEKAQRFAEGSSKAAEGAGAANDPSAIALEKKLGSRGKPAGSLEHPGSEDSPKSMTLGDPPPPPGIPAKDAGEASAAPPASESKREKRGGTRGGTAGATGGKSVEAVAPTASPTRRAAPSPPISEFLRELGSEALAARLERARGAEPKEARRRAPREESDFESGAEVVTIRVPIPPDTPPERLDALRSLLLDPGFALGSEVGFPRVAPGSPTDADGEEGAADVAEPTSLSPNTLEFRGSANAEVALENLRTLAAWAADQTNDLDLDEDRPADSDHGEQDTRSGFAKSATQSWVAPGGLRIEGKAAIVEALRSALRAASERASGRAASGSTAEGLARIRARIILETAPPRAPTESETPRDDSPPAGSTEER